MTLNFSIFLFSLICYDVQEQTSCVNLTRNCSENMQQIYRRTPTQKRDFDNVALH